jgi:Bacterial Ig domain
MNHSPLRARMSKNSHSAWRTTSAAAFAVGVALMLAQQSGRAQTPDPLTYAKGFLVTGNFVTGGVDLTPQQNPADMNGFATGTISMSGVPYDSTGGPPADIVAAFLYWEGIYKTGATPTVGVRFRGTLVDPTGAWPTGDVPGLKSSTLSLLGKTASCWGAAGQTGNAIITMFRYDVLHLLPKLYDKDNRWTGKRLVNDTDLANNYDLNGQPFSAHTVTLPETTGDQATQSAGATLVVIYRRTNDPLTKVVLYENLADKVINNVVVPGGVFTAGPGGSMSQKLQAFYQHAGDAPRLAHIVGNGGNNQSETLFFNSQNVMTNPFPQSSPSSDRSWANPTFPNPTFPTLSINGTTSADGYGETATTSVTHPSANPDDCLAWAGVAFSTPVLDADTDGLPDAVEANTNAGSLPWKNPDEQPLPDLHGMGATANHKDIFIEIGAMNTDVALNYGSATAPYDSSANPIVYTQSVPAHTHKPIGETLTLLGDAYKNAPVTNIDNVNGIRAHIDVGSTTSYGDCASSTPPTVCQYLVPTTVARGGELISERYCTGTDCQFPDYPGTVGWRFGYQANRDAAVDDNGNELTTPAQIQAWITGGVSPYLTHRMRFDPVRRSLFHYVLYAHARGKPRSLPCLVHGLPADYDTTTNSQPSCTTANPYFNLLDYHVPSSASGVGDLPGGGALITLGLWDAALGTATPFVQASTTFHELGHNGNLWHGGPGAIWGNKKLNTATSFEPNCKPPYQSTMSYMFQVHGLIDVLGNQHLDYSRTSHSSVNENALVDGALSPIPNYRPTWYAPLSSALATTLGVSAATRFCNGVKFGEAIPVFTPTAATAMARVWTPDPSSNTNWNVTIPWLGGNPGSVSNINFDAAFQSTQKFGTLTGYDDWSNLLLNQIGAGHNKVSFDSGADSAAEGADSAADGADSAAEGADSAAEGADSAAEGADSAADGADSAADGADSAADGADSAADSQELDFKGAKELGSPAPAGFQACIIGAPTTNAFVCPNDTDADPTHKHRTRTIWTVSNVGPVAEYRVYRVQGTTVPANINSLTPVGTTTSTSFVDTEELPNGIPFTYFVRTAFADTTPLSGRSNSITITALNDAPLAADDGGPPPDPTYTTVKNIPLPVQAPGPLSNDADSDSPTAFRARRAVLVTGPSHGTVQCGSQLGVICENGSFLYTPTSGYDGSDTIVYKSDDGLWSNTSTPLSSFSVNRNINITIKKK